MNHLPAPAGSPPRSESAAGDNQAHPLLGAFPLAVMAFGTLLVLIALVVTINADADGAMRPGTHSSTVAGSPATSRVGSRSFEAHQGSWLIRTRASGSLVAVPSPRVRTVNARPESRRFERKPSRERTARSSHAPRSSPARKEE